MLSPAGFLFSHTVDREHAQVTARVAGVAESRAVYRAPLGCVLVHGALPPPVQMSAGSAAASLLPPIAKREVVEATDPSLKAALARAVVEPDSAPHRWTKAEVVVHNGHVLAERYAPGFGNRAT